MGMAAGQARLLSITARMSDNELRAQIINNDKMRLATESSQVSDTYVQALNEAELMFTNYDANNNASFKQLTYNALTSFNPYNNQYALTNASGNILLSEKDAKNYKNSNNLEEFLKCYGLEKTTTYFNNLGMYVDAAGNQTNIVAFTNPNVEDDTKTLINETSNQPTGFTAEELYLAYLGNERYKEVNNLTEDKTIHMNGDVNIKPNGYETTLNSELYNEYFRYLDKYNQKGEQFTKSLYAIMQQELDKIIDNKTTNYATMEELLKQINNAQNTTSMTSIMNDLIGVIDVAKTPTYALQDKEVQEYYENLRALLELNSSNDVVNMVQFGYDASNPTVTVNSTFRYDIEFDDTGNPSKVQFYDENGEKLDSAVSFNTENTEVSKAISEKDADGNTETTQVAISWSKNEDGTYTLRERLVGKNTLENMKEKAKYVANSLKGSLGNCWDPLKSIFISQEPASTYYKEWQNAAQELANVIYGVKTDGTPNLTVSESSQPRIDDLGDIYVLYNAIEQSFTNPEDEQDYGPYPKFDDNFYQVYLNVILDKVQDTYGEPYFTWIDTSSEPNGTDSYNENGEAKAKWYTNIWNMCEKNGYRILKDGLASSTEWIQYAFESGIVNMQQVDTNGNWNSLIYTNCSDITSQTSDKMIAKAEAEYNSAMNKIENKDKRYDLELKNIDTEHNSLQTEYDSIKSALDKHIERVFKLYS